MAEPGASITPVWAIVAARMGSSRMPGKALAPLAGRPALAHVIARLAAVPGLDGVAVATTTLPEDDPIEALARAEGVPVWRGSPTDVLGRVLDAAHALGAATVVRVTGDCPLTDPRIVERVVAEYRERRPDYASNRLGGYKFPIGLDVEVAATSALERAAQRAVSDREREHVTLHLYEHPEDFDLHSVEPEPAQRRPDLRLTLDTPADGEVLGAIFEALHPGDPLFGLDAVLALLDSRPDLAARNRDVPQKAP